MPALKYFSAEHYIASHIKLEPKTGCHLWTGPFTRQWMRAKIHRSICKRFGLISTNAGRAIYALHHPGFDKSLLVCHGPCNNGMCVNVAHMHLGTTMTNAWERSSYGKVVKGENVHTHKLTKQQAKRVRSLHKRGVTVTEIIKLMNLQNISYSGVRLIAKNINWKDTK